MATSASETGGDALLRGLRSVGEGLGRVVLGGGKPGAAALRALFITLAALFVALALIANYVFFTSPTGGQALAISEVTARSDKGQVISAQLLEEDAEVVGRYCDQPLSAGACKGSIVDFHATYLRSDAGTQQLIDTLNKGKAKVSIDPQSTKGALRFVMTFILPLMILANIFGIIFLSRSGGGGLSEIVGFGSVGRQRHREKLTTGVTFADVAGADEAVAELREVKDYLLDPGRYKTFGAQPPKGVLLLGPPGCGKTLLARAVAGESGVPFFSISGAEFVESLVGVGAARVRDLFRQAAANRPAIIFIDELDAAARRRGVGGGTGGADEREQTLNQMLVAMDGFEVTSGIVVMAATNRPDILDPALLRPGRFDRHITVDEPDVVGRAAILKVHARNKPLASDVDLAQIADQTPGFTGADLANVINEAALLAIREGHEEIRAAQISDAILRIIGGPRRRGRLMTDDERRRIAFHESGHAIVAAALGHGAQVTRVSVVAKGRGLGQMLTSGDADRALLTEGQMADELVMMLAGAASEQLHFGDSSTSVEDDIQKASELARQMVGRYGMSSTIGPVRLMGSELDFYLAGDTGALSSLAPDTMREFDLEIKRLTETARTRAAEVLRYHAKPLDRLAKALVQAENLEGSELEKLLDLSPAKPNGIKPSTEKPAARKAAATARGARNG
ncbi:MAG TPA: ATP-dependent zinc metalloprotease FtsH [Candidatus Solibacter sp.]|nr:ATP-dependent zinc metalloprotease FtsH [Candidatus Solibacter sp.]